MIGKISGILVEKQIPELLIEVNGISYELLAPSTSFYNLPEPGQFVSIYTHFYVKEDAQQLYGFKDKLTRNIFRELLRTSGVGPKLALAILSGMEASQLVSSILDGQWAKLTAISGVGKKTAERLIIELRDRFKKQSSDLKLNLNHVSNNFDGSKHANPTALEDAWQALLTLGYKSSDAEQALAKIRTEEKEQATCEELIKSALRILA